MSATITSLPESFPAGTTVRYVVSYSDYPATDWTLKLHLGGARVLSFAATTDGTSFVVTLDAGDTAKLAAGTYRWAERVSHADGSVYEVASGVVTVTPDLADATDGSSQEWLERAIAALQSHVEGRLPAGLESYQVAGRAVSKMPIRDAMALLATLEARMARMRDPSLPFTRPVLTSFTPTGFDQ